MGLLVKSADCEKKQTVRFMPQLLYTHHLPISQNRSVIMNIDVICKFHEIKLTKTTLHNQELSSPKVQ
jgi:hypothetical protein